MLSFIVALKYQDEKHDWSQDRKILGFCIWYVLCLNYDIG